mmetsp:Transcript_115923/g.361090  ORF Transcript_115923/g.361090 Transcript_115923/m.361090 type:complete len:442 (+) Transcript_115923:140-1465(+)
MITLEEAAPLVGSQERTGAGAASTPRSRLPLHRLALAVIGSSIVAIFVLACRVRPQFRADARAPAMFAVGLDSVEPLDRAMSILKPLLTPSTAHSAPVAWDSNMHDRQPGKMTRALITDYVDAHWLLSPLMLQDFGNAGAQIGLYHAGIGFTNRRTGLDSSFQFKAAHFDASIVLPSMSVANRTMRWDNRAFLVLQEGKLDRHYWQKWAHIATVRGYAYNSLLEWVDSVAFPKYMLFNLAPLGIQVRQPHKPGLSVLPGWPPGSTTCFDVAQVIVDKIADLSGTEVFNRLLPGIVRDDQYLWVQPGTSPRKLDMSKQKDFDVAWKFFAILSEVDMLGSLAYSQPDKMARRVTKALARANVTWAVFVDQNEDYWCYKPSSVFAGYITSMAVPLPGGLPRLVSTLPPLAVNLPPLLGTLPPLPGTLPPLPGTLPPLAGTLPPP